MAAPRVPNPAKGDAPRVKTNQAFLRLSRRIDALEAALADLDADVEAASGGETSETLYTFHTTAGPAATTTQTATLSQSIPADTLDTDGQILEVWIAGTALNTSGSNQTWEQAISLGGVELYRDTGPVYASSATVRAWEIRFQIVRRSSTECHLGGAMIWQTNTASPDTGLGPINATQLAAPISSPISSPAVDWASAQDLEIAVTCSSNHASTHWLRRVASIDRRAPP